jgi:hypothetical protein
MSIKLIFIIKKEKEIKERDVKKGKKGKKRNE